MVSVTSRDERSIAARAVGGDQQAFRVLVERHLEPTFRIALAILGNEADARDVTQEIFIRVWQHLPELRDLSRFEAWLNRIVVNTCRTSLSLRRRHEIREVHLETLETATEPGAIDVADASARAQVVARAIDRLSVDDRTLLALHHFRGLSLADIGRSLGVSEKTVKSRMHTARRALERALEAER